MSQNVMAHAIQTWQPKFDPGYLLKFFGEIQVHEVTL